MNLPGCEIHRCYDPWGPIHVCENGNLRYLTFGEGGDQSCVDRANPARPVFEYTQAMLLALLFNPQPRHLTLLGLGAGALTNSLLHLLPDANITVVELREAVAEVARRWFWLPNSDKLELEICDARDFMRYDPPAADMLFCDIYLDNGMDDGMLREKMLAACYECLSDDGILVLNLWDQGKGQHPRAREKLSHYFGDASLFCPVGGGNLIAFAFKGGMPVINARRMQQQSRKLGKQLDTSFSALLEQLEQPPG